jgi:hypothetical protein
VPTENWRFGGGLSETLLHPVVLVAMIVSIIMVMVLPRKYVVVPFLFSAFLIPLGQEVFVAGMHFFVMRIIILFGWVRILWAKLSSQKEIAYGGLNPVDKAFTLWAVFRASAFMLLYLATGAIIHQFGFLWDAVGGYFLLRFLLRSEEDIDRAIKCFAVLAMILGFCMVNEQLSRHNIFGLLGGVRGVPEIREGRIRSQAVFQHPLLAGTFGATLLPLFLWLWKGGKSKSLAILGAVSSTVMAVTSACSTPLMTIGATIVALVFWPFRRRMRGLRWGIVIALVALHLAMKAPVWFVISHIDLAGGSSGYHRAMLVDQFIRNFREWWLVGTNSNQNWGSDMWDLTNQFVAEGETGGLATLICFIAMISLSFRRIGNARKAVEGDPKQEWYLWLLGTALFAHIVAFFGVSYFDQIQFAWFGLLAMISAATAPNPAAKTVPGYQGEMAPASPQLVRTLLSFSGSTASDFVGLRRR